jgi:hypothetical protein
LREAAGIAAAAGRTREATVGKLPIILNSLTAIMPIERCSAASAGFACSRRSFREGGPTNCGTYLYGSLGANITPVHWRHIEDIRKTKTGECALFTPYLRMCRQHYPAGLALKFWLGHRDMSEL